MMPTAQFLAVDFHYPTDPSNVFHQTRRVLALAHFLRRDSRSLFLSLWTTTERHES